MEPYISGKTLILFAHPALQKSRVNKVLATAVRDHSAVTFHDLYEEYPDYHIDIAREQELLEAHDVIVFQHPVFWYSIPSLLKEWLDQVFEHGWAYGREGNALAGKTLLSVMTTGAREDAYLGGEKSHTIRELMAPIEAMASLCGMVYPPPFVVHGAHLMTAETMEKHAADYLRVIDAISLGCIDFAKAKSLPRLNMDLDNLIAKPSKQP